jgi:hypothetical protein
MSTNKVTDVSKQRGAFTFSKVFSHYLSLKMKALRSLETSMARRNI